MQQDKNAIFYVFLPIIILEAASFPWTLYFLETVY